MYTGAVNSSNEEEHRESTKTLLSCLTPVVTAAEALLVDVERYFGDKLNLHFNLLLWNHFDGLHNLFLYPPHNRKLVNVLNNNLNKPTTCEASTAEIEICGFTKPVTASLAGGNC